MTITRTKQQIACDGVRTAWQNDTFTQILHQQVTTKFSMDGVIPIEKSTEVLHKEMVQVQPQESTVGKIEDAQKKLVKIVGTMDGVHRQLKPVQAT